MATPEPTSSVTLRAVTGTGKSGDIVLANLPAKLAGSLRSFDDDGDGVVSSEKLTEVLAQLSTWHETPTMVSSVPILCFPPSVRDTMKTFDVDHDGRISLAEIAHAAKLYQEAKNCNRTLMRYSVGLTVVFVLLLAGTFGVVYAGCLAVISSTTTLKAATAAFRDALPALQDINGVTLRTAGASLGAAPFTPVTGRRQLMELMGAHGRRLSSALQFVPAEEYGAGAEDLALHYRRPVRDSPGAHAWDASTGRSLFNELSPINGELYVAMGTTPVFKAREVCVLIKEGHPAIHMALPVTKRGELVTDSPVDYIVNMETSDVYGCSSYKTNGYGVQALVYHVQRDFVDDQVVDKTQVLLLDCPDMSNDEALCVLSVEMPPARLRRLIGERSLKAPTA